MATQSEKQTILVVDDTPDNIKILNGILRSEYKVKAALNGKKALQIAQTKPQPDLILLDIMMPEMDGYEVCRKLKDHPMSAKIPLIFVTAMSEVKDEKKGLDMGAVDYITKPISPSIVLARVQTHLALYDQSRELERKVRERTEELNHTRLEIIQRLGRAAEYKDNETGLHVIRMSHYSRLIAAAMDADEAWVERIFNAAPMHDIGKIGMPDKLLLKQQALNETEWQLMHKHPEFGVEILGENTSELIGMAKEIALNHHEKWDGSGYPQGLKGEEIPLSARIIAIADVFDALTTQRPYKKAWKVEDAVKFIEVNAGSHFDPKIVEFFQHALPEILKIKEAYAEQYSDAN